MQPATRLFLGILLILPFLALDPASPGQDKKIQRHALLVGVTRYDDMPGGKHLEGPAHDVALLKKILMERFGFEANNILTLAEGEKQRPTRANIKSAFEKLAQMAQPGDQVFVLLSGHGSQQPARNPAEESDGLDETFLPADTAAWNATTKTVHNAIIDDELGQWSKAILDRGAYLVVVIDSCHSGTALRGKDQEVLREVPAKELVPKNELDLAAQKASAKNVPGGFELGQSSARLVALYAAQPNEPAPELPPFDGSSPKKYGLLSYTLAKTLTQAHTPLTYREIIQRIHGEYFHQGRSAPTPSIEGTDLDREFLHLKQWPDRSRFILMRDPSGAWKVTGGTLHGLTRNSILAVYPPIGQEKADQTLGHVRVKASSPFEAIVEPYAYLKLPEPKDLPVQGRCELVHVEIASSPLTLALEKDLSPDLRSLVEKEIQAFLKNPEAPVQLSASPEKARWLIGKREGQLLLLPAPDFLSAKETSPASGFALDPAKLTLSLHTTLTRLARAQQLLGLASSSADQVLRGEASVRLKLEMVRFKNKSDMEGEPLRWEKGLKLQPGERVLWRITNPNRFQSIDVTLLFVDSQFGIHAIFPRPGIRLDNRLLPGKSFSTPALTVNAQTAGQEHLVMIALKAEGPQVDFTWLAQPNLNLAQLTQRSKDSLNTPLGKLLKDNVFGLGTQRDDPLGEYVMAVQSFQVLGSTKELEGLKK
jgi:hypothetical protein